jgi:hypothetical protein
MTQDEFYEKISEWISKPKNSWNHITLMAYFCHKYEIENNIKFRLVRWKSDPGKGKESRDFSRLFKTLAPEDYNDLKPDEKKEVKEYIIVKIYNYINWMFDYKFRSGEKSVTGTQIFLMPSMINEFERMYSNFLKKNKDVLKFSALVQWSKENIPEIFEMHQIDHIEDLNMIAKYVEIYNLEDDSLERALLNKAKTMEINT